MKKVGILLRSTTCSKYLYETVEELNKSEKVELFFLLNQASVSEKKSIFNRLKTEIKIKGFRRTLELILYKVITTLEYKILSFFSQKLRGHTQSFDITKFNKNETVDILPQFSASGLIVRYSDKDIEKIESLGLDLILKGNALGIFKGDIINASKEGIISFHHGDNRWNRGGPPAFWEVYLRKPSTGFIIQILTEELDGGSVIFRGNIPTKRSFTENSINLFSRSNYYMAKLILDYADSNTLPKEEERIPFGGELLLVPSMIKSLFYFLKTSWLFFIFAFKKIVLKKDDRWSVAFIKSPWESAILRKGIKIENPPKHFYADPFVITRENRSICYVEDYCYEKKKGYITAIELFNNNNYQILGSVLEEPFHLSFPFLLEYEDELYMIPETHEADAVRLYKCIDYPLKWEYQRDLLQDIRVVDSIIFEYEKRWWLLCNREDDHSSTLMAFYSDNPLSSNWKPHALNPLIFDNIIARNGGILDINSDAPIRARQKSGFNQYGKGFTLARIKELTPSTFKEEEIGEVSPDFFDNIKGSHHIHSNNIYTVYDYIEELSINK